MRKREIKKQLRLEMEQEFRRLSAYEVRQSEKLVQERKCSFMMQNLRRGIVFAALAGVILVSGVIGIKNNHVCTLVSVDVNPAFEIALNEKEQVLSIEAKNEDAKQILGDMNLNKTDAEVAINALIGAMYQRGYLEVGSGENVVLLTVDNKDSEKAKQIEEKLSQSIQEFATQSDSKLTVLSRRDTPTNENKAFAEQYDISWGRAMWIQRLAEQNPNLSVEEMAGMSIREMTAYLKENKVDYREFLDWCNDLDDDDNDDSEEDADKDDDSEEDADEDDDSEEDTDIDDESEEDADTDDDDADDDPNDDDTDDDPDTDDESDSNSDSNDLDDDDKEDDKTEEDEEEDDEDDENGDN